MQREDPFTRKLVAPLFGYAPNSLGYTDELVRRLPNSVRDQRDVPTAVALYRRLLAKQSDHSVTIVSVGGYTNLAGLLESKRGEGSTLDGRALAGKKVKRLVQMDGIAGKGQ